MEFQVIRVCADGRKQTRHVRNASASIGRLGLQQEADEARKRTVLVARLLPRPGQRSIPPLYDAVLLSVWGDMWIMGGFERFIAKGELVERSYAQTWHLAPQESAELITLDHRWGAAVAEAHDLRQLLERVAPGRAAEVPVARYGLPDGR